MFDYIEEIITAFNNSAPVKSGTKSIPSPVNLFLVDKYCKKLKQSKVVTLHNIVAKTLYVTKLAQPDTFTSISFLEMRIRELGEDDWYKLVWLM